MTSLFIMNGNRRMQLHIQSYSTFVMDPIACLHDQLNTFNKSISIIYFRLQILEGPH